MYDYANILFTGRCNMGCYGCIGENPKLKNLPINIEEFPPKNIDRLIEIVNMYKIKDLAFTGTNVDPQQYIHEKRLIEHVRSIINPDTNLSLHTNGLLALEKMEILNMYDKASVSFHSYNPETYRKMTRAGVQPDLRRILERATIPVKLSMLVTRCNIKELEDYVSNSAKLGIKRIVMRKPKGRDDEFPIEKTGPFAGIRPTKYVFGWPVYRIDDMEITICGFDKSTAKGVFLFSDGTIEEMLV